MDNNHTSNATKRKTKTSSSVKTRYNLKTYDRLSVWVAKGTREALQAASEKSGMSQRQIINNALEKYLFEEYGINIDKIKKDENGTE